MLFRMLLCVRCAFFVFEASGRGYFIPPARVSMLLALFLFVFGCGCRRYRRIPVQLVHGLVARPKDHIRDPFSPYRTTNRVPPIASALHRLFHISNQFPAPSGA